MSVKVELIGVGVIMVVDTEINTALGGMKMMVLLMYLITVMDWHVLLASMILMIGVVNVMMKEVQMEVKLLILLMNVLITQTTPIMSVIIMIIITIIIMEMTITMKLTMIM